MPFTSSLPKPDRDKPLPLATDFAGAAEMSGLSRSALYQAAGRGELLVHKWRARSVILLSDLEDYLKALPLGSYKRPDAGDETAMDELLGSDAG